MTSRERLLTVMSSIKFGIWGFGRMGSQHGRFYAMEQDKLKLVVIVTFSADPQFAWMQ